MLVKLRIVYDLLDRADRRKLALILSVSLLNGLINAAGIVSILPFIGLISDPEILDSNRYILLFRSATGIESYAATVVSFGLISLGMLMIGNTITAFQSWYGTLFGASKNQTLSSRLLANYLQIDVLEFEKKKSAERAKEVLSDVGRVVISTLFSTLDLIAEVFLSAFVVGVLLWIDWKVTLIVFSVLILVHFVIHFITSSQLDRLGKRYAALQAMLYSHVLEALKLNKEVKMNGIAPYFVRRFHTTSGRMVRNNVKSTLVSEIPQHVLEVVAFGAILSVALYFAVAAGDNGQPVTIIGMYAVAAYRLIPSVARIFSRIKSIWYDTAILEDVAKALMRQNAAAPSTGSVQMPVRTLSLRAVSFSYAESGPFHIEGLNLDFPVNGFTCIKGKTGCGKSTVLNLLAGLYRPAEGSVMCDERPVDAHGSPVWKQQVGLVPAVVNLIQASLFENIALGAEGDEMDRDRVHEVAVLTELDEHVRTLPRGYDSVYGEDGLSFSSGQILKVGIARALYRNPRIMLMDESTDAFDLKTEQRILNRLKGIDGLTIIFVSHRPSVMEFADCVIDLEDVLETWP